MSKINPISSSKITGIQTPAPSRKGLNLPQSISFYEQFKAPEIELKEDEVPNLALEERVNREILCRLFGEILSYQIDIYPQKPKDHGNYAVEASFIAAKNKTHAKLLLPLRGVFTPLMAPQSSLLFEIQKTEVLAYVDQILLASSDTSINRIIIVAAHELGHYLSFIRGNHDKELKIGIYLMQQKLVSSGFNYLYLVFREESLAWRYGLDKITKFGFSELDLFKSIKNHSLKTYFKVLNLVNAPLEIYYRLSMLGDDFFENSESILFNQN